MSPPNGPVTFETVFAAEVEQIEKARGKRGVVTGSERDSVKESLIGLAFSGGGIRSATFNLGILQALAKNRLLHKFDYLSSVSGGGYISGWLAGLTRRFLRTVPVERSIKDSFQNLEIEFPETVKFLSFADVEDSLKPEAYQPGQRRERSFVHWLRLYSNYLTPKSGLLSGDTWAMVGTWLRNAFLNQTILLLCFLGVFGLCQSSLLWLLNVPITHAGSLLILGAIAWFVAAFFLAMNLTGPWRETGNEETPPSGWQRVRVTVSVILPFFLACLFLNFGLRWKEVCTTAPWWEWLGAGALFYPLAWAAGEWVVRLRLWLSRRLQASGKEMEDGTRDGKSSPRLLSPTVFLISSSVAGAVGSGLVWVYRRWLEQVPSYLHPATGTPSGGGSDWVIAVFGTGLLMLILLLTGVLHVGLAGGGCRDLVREWWARLGGYMILFALGWLFLASACVFGPLLVRWAAFKLGTRVSVSGVVAWILANWAGVFAAKSSTTSGEPGSKATATKLDGLQEQILATLKSPRGLDAIAKVAPYVFIVGLVLLLATAVHVGSGLASDAAGCTKVLWHIKGNSPACCMPLASSAACKPLAPTGCCMMAAHAAATDGGPTLQSGWSAMAAVYWQIESAGSHGKLLIASVVLVLVSFLLSVQVDVNDFSLHHFYRNRLVRCYLGASNPHRKPQRFTGFDPDDDLPLIWLSGDYPGPYPILNAALNITAGEELGYATRRAKSFVFTPLYCGYERNRPGRGVSRFLPANVDDSTFSPTHDTYYPTFAPTSLGRTKSHWGQPAIEGMGGIKLGTAMAISGAAASPNMGYYTRPGTALLMTLFDVRLGWWMGNPRYQQWQSTGPRIGLYYLFSELIAQSDQNKSYVYLSDGGHFENLAVYELIRRRCKLIVACDADCDGKYQFDNLLGLIEKARADFGAQIVIDCDKIRPAEGQRTSARNYAVGTIYYDPQQPEDHGTFIYIKTSMPPREAKPGPEQDQLPDDVWQYYDKHITFPHQSTADQWFDELQFESYRALGEHIGKAAAEEIGEKIKEVFR